ncbi:Innexin inx2 [Sarcoptes scabiei]|uniref:Innexin n=1 Tax=Sarcoptes scabiei TaxID=52283 RepID=A0A834VC09_SARSC|nr:Innexin inx2 [Sarcoptes scabiei]
MFDELKALFGFLQRRSLSIDGLVFGITCRMTSIFLLFAMCIVCSTQLIGKPIDCDSVGGLVDKDFLNTFCFIHPTYIVESPQNIRTGSDPVENVVFPGVIPLRKKWLSTPIPLIKLSINYYQWMWAIYLMQAIIFYFPHWLWKTLEGGRVRSIVGNVDLFVEQESQENSKNDKLARMASYIAGSIGHNDRYMFSYYLCEFIAFFNAITQFCIIDWLFGGQFLTYGHEVFRLLIRSQAKDFPIFSEHSNELDIVNKIFPRMTKCEYRRYGPSGSAENIDALCMLPLNVFNDKFFLFIWCWILLLLTFFLMTFLYRSIQFICPRFRLRFIRNLMRIRNKQSSNEIDSFLFKLKLSDWFFLNLVSKKEIDSKEWPKQF